MKHLFVINPLSFPVQAAQDRVVEEIKDCFASLKSGEYAIRVSRYPRNAIAIIRKWIEEPRHGEIFRIYAVGGDGILFDCLNGIVGLPDTELASVPYGTSNDFIRAFGDDKKSLFRDIKLQVKSPSVQTDIIHCGNNYALNFCTVGLESDTTISSLKMYNVISGSVRKYYRLNKFFYNMLFYIGGIMAVFNKEILRQHYTITIDGADFSGVYGSINIANGPCYGGDKSAVITAMPDDGLLDALFFKCASSLKTAAIITRFLKGEFRKFPANITWKQLKKIEMRSDDPLLINLDGEVFFDTNLTVEIIPNAIKFVTPDGIGYAKRGSNE